MYIPVSYFGGGDGCINATGGVTGSYISGSQIWKYHKFTATGSASFEVLGGNVSTAKLLIVAGGGAAGQCATGVSSTFDVAGGGGGGGVFYTTNLNISSGSYPLYIGNGGTTIGSNGENSWFQYPYTITNTSYYVSGDRIETYGGGFGGYTISTAAICPARTAPSQVASGSAGGWSGLYDCGQGGYQVTGSGGKAFGQGYPSSKSTDYNTGVMWGAGGSGAGGVGGIIPAQPHYPGGGFYFDITGPYSPIEVSVGGFGYSANQSGTSGRILGAGGNARQGRNVGYNSDIRGISGSVIIAYPLCDASLTCSQYVVYGGALGGNLTYIPCGQSELITSAINPNFTGSICVQQIDGYPSSSSTVSIISTGSCDTYIPLPNEPLCTGSFIQAPSYLYDFSFLNACYPTPQSCQSRLGLGGTITYTTTEGLPVTASYGLGVNSVQICAREFPVPTIACATGVGGSTTPCSVTKSSIICGYYCLSDSGSSQEAFFNTTSTGSTAICSTTGSAQPYFLHATASIQTGSTIYSNAILTSPVTASYFKQDGSTNYFTTNNSGLIISSSYCPQVGTQWRFSAPAQPPYVNYSFTTPDNVQCYGQLNPFESKVFCVKIGTTPAKSSPVGGNSGAWTNLNTPCSGSGCNQI
jgi:hypothetical protein